ncbi:MAG: hypothetical protein V2I51_15395, partial [Anderseniella sp.]|nr:hypothetical protein [Anderseniella sp.]
NWMNRFTHNWLPVTLLLTGLGVMALLVYFDRSGSNVVHEQVASENPACSSCDARHSKLQSNRRAMERLKGMPVEPSDPVQH